MYDKDKSGVLEFKVHGAGRRHHIVLAEIYLPLCPCEPRRLACTHELVAAMGYDPQGQNKQRPFPRSGGRAVSVDPRLYELGVSLTHSLS